VAFFEKAAQTMIAIQARNARYHLAQLMRLSEHTVKSIAPQLAKPR
jgi:hypothetical protein